jgi:hypothetical protein
MSDPLPDTLAGRVIAAVPPSMVSRLQLERGEAVLLPKNWV